MDPSQLTAHLTAIITAIGGLGTAAFGLLEAIKPICPVINRIGFGGIRKTVSSLTPPEADAKTPMNALPSAKVLESLEANWVNGTDLASQKAIAKSLIKLHLSAGNAAALATATNVDSNQLTAVATSIVSATSLTQQQGDAYSRFDLIVTAMLDECYQRSDQVYRNWMRGLAALIAVLLSVAGGWILASAAPAAGSAPLANPQSFWGSQNLALAILIGLLATPLAPIAKDLSTALAAAVNTVQLVKKP
ncbi:MAG: hypothetical protein P4L56_31320 [Candidatus Sulfopaludibacter sp.]|nr:hypothetical protein [Candidatus Sulfopaludibacter sp.]